MKLSVIIPCYQDHQALIKLLASSRWTEQEELIVVDATEGGHGPLVFGDFPQIQWLSSNPNRAEQMNLGAAQAQGEYLLFLHADSKLSEGWVESLLAPFSNPSVLLTCFRFSSDSSRFRFRLLEFGVWLRCLWFQLPYGDQGFCLKTTTFREIGGFPEQELMEDYALVGAIKKKGQVKTITTPLITSVRRWEKQGLFKTSCLNLWMLILFRFRVPPAILKRMYRSGSFKFPVDSNKGKR